MTGMSNYSADNWLDYITGQIAMPSLPSVYLALFTAVGTDAGTGFTEVSGGAYARVQVAGSTTTSSGTSSGSPTLTFSSVPSWIVVGMTVYDVTHSAAIPSGTTVSAVGSTTVTLSGNVASPGVSSSDTIVFSAFGAGSGTSPSSLTNGSVITFPQATASWGTVIAFGLYDASSSGDLLAWDYLGNNQWQPCTISSASPGVFTAHAHGFAASASVVYSTEYGGTAPTFSQSNLTGVLTVNSSPATDTFSVNNGGTNVNTSATGNGMVRQITQQSIPANVTASFAASALTLQAA